MSTQIDDLEKNRKKNFNNDTNFVLWMMDN